MSNTPMDKSQVPQATVPRLARYLRVLHRLQRDGIDKVSSKELAERLDSNAAQIRKDFSYFGEFGVRGVGYEVEYLIENLSCCLGLSEEWNVVIIGAGKLGAALAQYRGFQEEGYHLAGIFDASKHVVGQELDGSTVRHERELPAFLESTDVHIAIVTVPAESAQAVVDKVVAGGVKGIVNFAPTRISTPEGVFVRQVDLSTELMVVSFYLSKKC